MLCLGREKKAGQRGEDRRAGTKQKNPIHQAARRHGAQLVTNRVKIQLHRAERKFGKGGQHNAIGDAEESFIRPRLLQKLNALTWQRLSTCRSLPWRWRKSRCFLRQMGPACFYNETDPEARLSVASPAVYLIPWFDLPVPPFSVTRQIQAFKHEFAMKESFFSPILTMHFSHGDSDEENSTASGKWRCSISQTAAWISLRGPSSAVNLSIIMRHLS